MKKAYKRPIVYFESTETTQNPSSGCEAIANLAENQCSITVTDPDLPGVEERFFTIQIICEPVINGDSFCYHAPTEWNNVYSS